MYFHRDCEVLLAAVQRDPSDAHSVFYLAQTYECLSDLANARIWWERFAQLGDRDEVVYYAMLKSAVMMESLGEPPARGARSLLAGLGIPAHPGRSAGSDRVSPSGRGPR